MRLDRVVRRVHDRLWMALSGKTAVSLADYYEAQFEWTYFGDPEGGMPRVVCIEELRDFFIECDQPDQVVEWARQIPRSRGQIKEHILACRTNTPLMLRFAEDILKRPAPLGRYVDERARKRLLEALASDGYSVNGGRLVGTPEALARNAAASVASSRVAALSTAAVETPAKATPLTERECMLRTVELARKCRREDATKPTPFVAALVVKDGIVLSEAYRGELAAGDHAEFTLLKKKLDVDIVTLAGTTLFTTLEPCTSRSEPKTPCAERVVSRKFGRVVIGTLDPNPAVSGKGVQALRAASIQIDMYPHDLMTQLEELNEEFFRSFAKSPK